jgi:hypothetical protein
MFSGDGWSAFLAVRALIGSSYVWMMTTLVCFSILPPACRVFLMMVLLLYYSSRSSRCWMLCLIGCLFAELVVLRKTIISRREHAA